jgi:phosphatidylinositol alpha-mannosyltransferase
VRVGVVCPYSVSRHGGVQGQALGLARTLQALGHRATVIAPLDPPRPHPSRRADGAPARPHEDPAVGFGLAPGSVVGVGRSVPVPANGSRAPLALHPAALIRAAETVRHGSFDVLHLHEPLAPGPGYAGLLVAGPPKVGTFHRAGASAGYRALGPAARWAAGRLQVRCAVSEAARATAAHALGGEYRVIPNGVDTDRFATAAPSPTQGPTVLFVGRHEERKGLGVLLDAWDAAAPGLGPDAVLWVSGHGPLTDALRERHGDGSRIEWLGALDDAELAGRLRGAHVMCAPSLAGESFGVVLLEAMAARTAVVASDLPGYASVVDSSARLVPPGDIGSLSAALVAAVGDARSALGSCAPEALDAAARRAEHWSMRAVTERYLDVYEELAEVRSA